MRSQRRTCTPARLNRNQFGANFGGPLYIPHIYDGHDKTFFFFNWETGKLLNGANVQQAIVPDNNIRAGILDATALTSSSGKPLNVVDPISGHKYQIGDQVTVDPRSAIMMQVTPAPNVTNANSATNYNTIPVNTLNYQYDYIGRMDHNLTRKDTVSGHYIYDETYSNGPSFFGNDEDNNDAFNHLIEVSEIHVFSPSIVNEFRYGHQNFQEFETFGTTNNAKYNISSGLMQIPFASSDPHFYGGPNITISGPDGSHRLFADLRNIGPRNRANGINQFVDNLSYQRGRHYLKFGVNIGRRTDYFSQARDPHGTFNFTGQYTGSALVDYLLGYIASDSINPTVTRTNISSIIQAYSVQDNWSVTKTLTLNLGFRWDHFAPYTQDDNKYADIYNAANGLNPDKAVTPATSLYGRGLIQPTYHDFQPRIGFAWQPYGLGKTVVRGGYGIYFTPEIDNAPFSMGEGDQAQAGSTAHWKHRGDRLKSGAKDPQHHFQQPFPGGYDRWTFNVSLRHFDRSASAGPDDAGVQPDDTESASRSIYRPDRLRGRARDAQLYLLQRHQYAVPDQSREHHPEHQCKASEPDVPAPGAGRLLPRFLQLSTRCRPSWNAGSETGSIPWCLIHGLNRFPGRATLADIVGGGQFRRQPSEPL